MVWSPLQTRGCDRIAAHPNRIIVILFRCATRYCTAVQRSHYLYYCLTARLYYCVTARLYNPPPRHLGLEQIQKVLYCHQMLWFSRFFRRRLKKAPTTPQSVDKSPTQSPPYRFLRPYINNKSTTQLYEMMKLISQVSDY